MFRLGKEIKNSLIVRADLMEVEASPNQLSWLNPDDTHKYRPVFTPGFQYSFSTPILAEDTHDEVNIDKWNDICDELLRVSSYTTWEDQVIWQSPLQQYLTFLNKINIPLYDDRIIYSEGVNVRCRFMI